MKDLKIILITTVIVLVLVWVGLPLLDAKSKAPPPPAKKTMYVVVDKHGNEVYKIITRDE